MNNNKHTAENLDDEDSGDEDDGTSGGPRATGTGFVWDDAGHIVTNFHVVAGALPQQSIRIRVRLHLKDSDGSTRSEPSLTAQFVGGDPDRDIALLRLEGRPDQHLPRLVPIRRGSSKALRVGQRVYAIGSPFGLPLTLTTGIVSGLGREMQPGAGSDSRRRKGPRLRRPIFGVIQTDAAINPGSSGGPLLDSSGRVVGITAAIATTSAGAFAGVGFALPIDTVARIVERYLLPAPHRVPQPSLGILLAPSSLVRRMYREGQISRPRVKGVLVRATRPGGPAQRAGIIGMVRGGGQGSGDVMVSIDGVQVSNDLDVLRALDSKDVHDVVSIEIIRSPGERLHFDIRLEDGSEGQDLSPSIPTHSKL